MNKIQLTGRRLMSALALILISSSSFNVNAQRITDKLNRGLVAVPSSTSGNLVSWRVLGEEYYDVTYNLYCNGSKIAENLTASNYNHSSGTSASKYQVAAVVRGVEQELSDVVTRWENGVLTIPVANPTDRDGNDVSSHYVLNDISLGDLDGDGITEFIVKRRCDAVADVTNTKMFHQLDCYDHKGNRLWWIDLGPNMLAGADEQWDCVCFDWDRDGKAEVLLRIQDNAYIHHADGTTTTIGSTTVDTRWSGIEYTSSGNEYLLYLEGATGKPYQIGPSSHPDYMSYPLTRGLDTDWGSGIVGHRSTKHYFGAPYLDGRKASIFLGRGCYTKHKMTAYDVDPETHALTQRWYWETSNSSSPWFGNGYHNFAVGDVDWDGRDEIIFGSMVIDDNGYGLSTTAYGHGDAQHCSDFDPYRKYEEQFGCLEEYKANYGCNYRNAATSKVYVKHNADGDDGRALMANFTNDYPGSVGRSVSSSWISSVADKFVSELNGDAFISWGDLNQRIYWDGDLLDEYFDSPGTEGYGAIYKPAGTGRWNFPDSKCNNWSKNNPGAIADIYGDWREELVMRKSDNTAILVYTTPIYTKYRIPTLWSDHQYRNAMVWQSMGYNQPPHKSYFLGELEGITQAPPTNTMTGRVEIADGGTITSVDDHLIVCEMNDTKINIQDGASPYMVTFYVPSWVQGTAAGNTTVKATPINYDYYTCEVSGGALTGDMRLVKQGDGILKLPKVDMTYTGETNVWAGTLEFDGTLKKSPLWLNRFAELNSDGGEFMSIKADYGSVIRPGGADNQGVITVDSTLALGFGSRIVLDLYSDGLKCDKINADKLSIEKKTASVWQKYGPQYLQPVIEVVEHMADGESTLATGDYIIGKVGTISGSLANIRIEGVTENKTGLSVDDQGNLILSLGSVRGATEIVWTGDASTTWDFANALNFYVSSDENKTPDYFVKNDVVDFTDEASSTTVNITEDVAPDVMNFNFSSPKAYTVSGIGSIVSGSLVKEGTGTVTISTENSYTGGNYLKGGTVKVSVLANDNKATGNLGAMTTNSNLFTIENGAVLQTTATVTNGSPIRFIGEEGGVINNSADFTQSKSFYGTVLTKKGNGWLKTYSSGSYLEKMIIAGGTVQNNSGNVAKAVEFQNGTLYDNQATTNPINVPSGKTGTWYLANINSVTFSNKITGEGKLNIYCPVISGSGWYATRTHVSCNFSEFTGTICPYAVTTADGRFSMDTSNGPVNGTFNIPSGVIVQNTGKTFKMGQLTGTGTLGGYASFSNNGGSGANTWQAGNDDTNFTFDGLITENSLFVKTGDCKMTVNGAWTNTGSVNIKAGEVHIGTKACLGTGALTVAQGATLSGTNGTGVTMTNSSVTVNGTLQVGILATSYAGYMDFGAKNVTFGAASNLLLGVRSKGSANTETLSGAGIKNVKTLKFNTGAKITLNIYSSLLSNIAAGDTLRLWSGVTTVTGVPTVVSSVEGLSFDTSRISEGIVVVDANSEYFTGIDNISADENVTVDVINASGVKMLTFSCRKSDISSTLSDYIDGSGLYILKVRTENGRSGVMKIMK